MRSSPTLPFPRFQDGPSSSAWSSIWPLLVGIGLLIAFALVLVVPRRQAAELGRLPDEVRATLFQHTRMEVSAICGLPVAVTDGVVREHCIAQARFLSSFPECDHRCQLGARAVLPHAHR